MKIYYFILIIVLFLNGCGDDSNQNLILKWSQPEKTTIGFGDIATNSKGEFLVATRHDSGSQGTDIKIYDPQRGWKAKRDLGYVVNINLDINDNGQAICMYWDNDILKAVQYSPQTGWSDPQIISAGLNMSFLRCVMDGDGVTTAVWTQVGTVSNFDNIYYSRFDKKTGWSQPAQVNHTSEVYSSLGGIAVSETGQVLLTWCEYKPPNLSNFESTFYKSVYHPGAGWSNPEPFFYNSANLNMSNKMDRGGNVFLIFGLSGPGYVGRIGINSSLEYKNLIHPFSPLPPFTISVNKSGNALITWWSSDGISTPRVCGITYSPVLGWSSDDYIKNVPSSAKGGGLFTRNISGIDDYGNMFLVYANAEKDTSHVYLIQSTPYLGWGNPIKLSKTDPLDILDMHLAVSPNGTALLNWQTIENGSPMHIGSYLSFYRLSPVFRQ